MITKTVNIKIPTPVYNLYESGRQAVAWTKWQLKGPRCAETGKLLFTPHLECEGTSHGQRIMFTSWGKDALSPEGLRIRFNRYWERKVEARDVETNTCDCCKQTKYTIDVVWGDDAKKYGEDIDVRFGMAWWNGFYLCHSCINEALTSDIRTKHAVIHLDEHAEGKKKYYAQNKFGYKKYLDSWV